MYRKKSYLKPFGLTILFLMFLGGGIYLMNRPFLMVQELSIKGHQTIAQERIEAMVSQHLKLKWLGIIPRSNIFFLATQELQEKIVTEYPRIYDIDIHNDLNDLDIVIQERSADSLWCVDKEYESIFDQECYFTDQRGVWYARAPYFSDNVLLKIYLSPEKERIRLGSSFSDYDTMQELMKLLASLKDDYDIELQKLEIGEQGDITLFVRRLRNISFLESPQILLNRKDDMEKIHRNIALIFKQAAFQKDLRDRAQDFVSLDLRFAGRIFYRFLNTQEREKEKAILNKQDKDKLFLEDSIEFNPIQ